MAVKWRTLNNGGGSSGGGGDVTGPAASVDDRIATYDGITGKIIQDGGKTIAETIAAAVAASGDVDGPAASVDDRIATYDGITGKIIQDGGYTIAEVIAAAGGLLQTYDVTITNAQFKALPTTTGGVRVLVTPAAGKYLAIVGIEVIGKIDGGAYSNASSALSGLLKIDATAVSSVVILNFGGNVYFGYWQSLPNDNFLASLGLSITFDVNFRGGAVNPSALTDKALALTVANLFTNGVATVSRAGAAAAGTTDLGNFTSEQSVNSGAGTGAIFHITKAGGVYTVTLVTPGNGFAAADTLTYDGADLGGLTVVNDLVVTVATVQTVTQDFTGGAAGNYLRFIIQYYELTF